MTDNCPTFDENDYAYDESGGVVASAPKRGYASCLSQIAGVGPDAPTVTAANGTKQSHTPYRCDLLPAKASLHIAEILAYGAKKYGDNNWRGLKADDHINHALTHLFAHQAGDTQDDHIGHAACRMLMALETVLMEGK